MLQVPLLGKNIHDQPTISIGWLGERKENKLGKYYD
jgi:hypothetical protein